MWVQGGEGEEDEGGRGGGLVGGVVLMTVCLTIELKEEIVN